MFLVMFAVLEWARTVLKILELNKQSYVSKVFFLLRILLFLAKIIINMHRLNNVLCFFKYCIAKNLKTLHRTSHPPPAMAEVFLPVSNLLNIRVEFLFL